MLSLSCCNRLAVSTRLARVYRAADSPRGQRCALLSLSTPPLSSRGQKIFIQGLQESGAYYAHPETTVFKLTSWPEGYPDGYDLTNSNVADYRDRGWCFAEECWASLTKDFAKSLDLGLYHSSADKRRRLHGTNGVLPPGAARPNRCLQLWHNVGRLQL